MKKCGTLYLIKNSHKCFFLCLSFSFFILRALLRSYGQYVLAIVESHNLPFYFKTKDTFQCGYRERIRREEKVLLPNEAGLHQERGQGDLGQAIDEAWGGGLGGMIATQGRQPSPQHVVQT